MSAVDHLVAGIRHEQWSAPTPCTDWNVHDLVNHLVGMNLVFAALMSDQPPPQRGADRLGNDPLGAYRDSGVALAAAFDQPGVLERTFHGPLGAATGAERLNIRIADLLVHGWDLSQATGQPAELPEDLAEEALAFVRAQLLTQPRTADTAQSRRSAKMRPRSIGSPLFSADLSTPADERDLTHIGSRALCYCAVRC